MRVSDSDKVMFFFPSTEWPFACVSVVVRYELMNTFTLLKNQYSPFGKDMLGFSLYDESDRWENWEYFTIFTTYTDKGTFS